MKRSLLTIILLTTLLTACSSDVQMHVDGVDYLHKGLSEESKPFVYENKGTLTVHKYSTKQLEQMTNSSRFASGVHASPSEENKALTEAMQTAQFSNPVKGAKYTSAYGWRWGKMHHGSDFAAPTGTPIMSIGVGSVTSLGYHSSMGNYAITDVKMNSKDYKVIYMHMDKKSPLTIGDLVTTSTQIGVVGSTGNSTGPHLHLEIHGEDPGKEIIKSMVSTNLLEKIKRETWFQEGQLSKFDPAYFFPQIRGQSASSQVIN